MSLWPVAPWHMELSKQDGVPVTATGTVSRWFPWWQPAQTTAFWVLAFAWVRAVGVVTVLRQGDGEWGAVRWHEKQLGAEPLPESAWP